MELIGNLCGGVTYKSLMLHLYVYSHKERARSPLSHRSDTFVRVYTYERDNAFQK